MPHYGSCLSAFLSVCLPVLAAKSKTKTHRECKTGVLMISRVGINGLLIFTLKIQRACF